MIKKQMIAIDLGAESGRSILGNWNGETLTLEEVHRFPNSYVSILGTMYWDVPGLWRNILEGLKAAVASSSGGQAASVGVDTWGVDYALIRDNGELAGLPVHYRDSRTDGIMDRVFSKVPRESIFDLTGLQFLKFNTLFQLYSVMDRFGLSGFDGVSRMLLMPDLFHYYLTGNAFSEYTIASTTQMLEAKNRQWATELMQMLRLPTDILPPVIQTGHLVGSLHPSVSREVGAAGLRVIATAEHDTAAAVAAVPATGDNWCYISSGTWSLMGVELEEPSIHAQGLADNFTNEGGVDRTIRYLKNIMGLWLIQQLRKEFAAAGRVSDYEALMNHASETEPFGPIVNPDHHTFLAPESMTQAIANELGRTGQKIPQADGEWIRCCLESLALRYRKTLEQLRQNTGRTIDTIHIVGGGSQNSLLCQMTADCCHCRVVAGPVEATAIGNCLTQAMGLREIDRLSDIREVVSRSFDTRTFEPKTDDRWDQLYEQFESIEKEAIPD